MIWPVRAAHPAHLATHTERIGHHRHHVRHQHDVEAFVFKRQVRAVGFEQRDRLVETKLGRCAFALARAWQARDPRRPPTSRANTAALSGRCRCRARAHAGQASSESPAPRALGRAGEWRRRRSRRRERCDRRLAEPGALAVETTPAFIAQSLPNSEEAC